MCQAVVIFGVITRVESVDLGQFLFTSLEEFLLKLSVVPLDCILICDYKKMGDHASVILEEHSGDHIFVVLVDPQCRKGKDTKAKERTAKAEQGQEQMGYLGV